VSNEELARSIKAGDVRRDDWLWHERLGQWTAAGTIDFLWPGQADDYANTGSTDAAEKPRDVLAAKELPPLPPRRNLPRQPARTEPRPPPLPNT
jgi:hypothetical protein